MKNEKFPKNFASPWARLLILFNFDVFKFKILSQV